MFRCLNYFTHKMDTKFTTFYFFESFDQGDSYSLEIRAFIGCH